MGQPPTTYTEEETEATSSTQAMLKKINAPVWSEYAAHARLTISHALFLTS
jgi:hypothetical protein